MPVSLTPMMQQYIALKEKYSDCLLFFRLGDFYEMFFEDAVTASRELEIVLTGRDCGLSERAPMCGVPHHSVDTYINKLIQKGYKVAICEQLTDPAESKGLVERDVIRVITPGTVIEECMLKEGVNNFILCVFANTAGVGVAYCDISTGAFYVEELDKNAWQTQLRDELARTEPTEVIANGALFLNEQLISGLRANYYMECVDEKYFEYERSLDRVLRHFKLNSIESCGCAHMTNAVCAAGALLDYLENTQKNALVHINRIRVITPSGYMSIDAATRRNLELAQPIRTDAGKKGTLLSLLDNTETAMGARLLRSWLEQPLQSVKQIEERLDAVDELRSEQVQRGNVKNALKSIYDIERLCSRIAYGTVNARDCEALKLSLEKLPEVYDAVKGFRSAALMRIYSELDLMDDIFALLSDAIVDDPPISVKDGGIIKAGYNTQVDEYRDASAHGREWLAKLEADERKATGIKNLKVGYNRVFGYYIDITKSYQHLVPYNYERKQTLANSERYVTEELKQLENTILGAEENCIALEYKLFVELRELLTNCIERLQKNSALISELDVYVSNAEIAFKHGYCRPKMTVNGVIDIKDGRHPAVEQTVREGFIPNDTKLDSGDNRLLIITGPNMAGKSTYMRQVALIVLMAHMGCFVPAASASISITDKIFTRVGASDNLASGQSTFMVEMNETANILNNATENSLLIIDEIGRGTSTFDGLSIAWAVLEHIADRMKCGAKTLFATHYHELTELEGKLDGVINYRISVKEIGDDIIFLRKIVRGGTDKSFGIQVARLAGLPDSVIQRAHELLKMLETADINRGSNIERGEDETVMQQMTLFGSAAPNDIMEELQMLDVNSITPMEAMKKLYDLHLRSKLR